MTVNTAENTHKIAKYPPSLLVRLEKKMCLSLG
jgi:hypothetical protein